MADRKYTDMSSSKEKQFCRPREHDVLASTSSSGMDLGMKSSIAGGIAGVTDVMVTYPTDFVKTQLQLDKKHNSEGLGRKMYSGIVDCVSKTIKTDGFFGLYRGMNVVLLGSFPRSAVRFCAFETLKSNLHDNGRLSYQMRVVCGLGAGLCESVFVVTPFESIKVKFIDDSRSETRKFKGFFQGVARIYRDEGILCFYQGLAATMLKQGISQSIRFFVMETCKDQYRRGDPSKHVPKFVLFLFGALSGMTSVFGNTPFDVVQTRMQSLEASTKYTSTANCFIRIWTEEGFNAFYKGLIARLVRVCFGSAVTFVTYETIMDIL